MTNTAFSYKPGSSFFHRCPAWIKILFIPVVSIAVFKLPVYFTAGFFLAQMLTAFALRFTVREQLQDLKAVLYYALFLIIAKICGTIASGIIEKSFEVIELSALPKALISFLISEKETGVLLLKLLCVMQSASLLFKTSSSLQIREGLEVIELKFRKIPLFHHKNDKERPNTPIAQTVSIFICFIPQVSKNWQQAERAWKARGGRKSLKMFVVLLPVFFSVGMKQAYNTAKAICARQIK